MAMIETPNLLSIAQAFTQGQRDRAEIERGRMEQEFTRRKMEDAEELRTARKEAQGLYASGDVKGARTRAVAGGDFDFVDFMNKADESQQAAIAKRAEVVGNMAQWADTPEKWDNAVDQLVAMGYGDLASQKGRFSPEARMAAIAASGQVKDYFERTKPVNMSPGGRLVDPTTGRVIAQAPFAPHPITVGEGQTVVEYAPGGGGLDDVWRGMIGTESRGQQFGAGGQPLTSPAGAIGIAQVMPGTAPEAARLAGLEWDENRYRTDPAYNEALGRAYFEKQVQDFGGDIPKAVAAYNAGPGNVQKAVERGGENWQQHLPTETKGYLNSVLGPAGSRVIATGAPKPSKEWETLSKDEADALGLPDGVFQRSPNGEIKAVTGTAGKPRKGSDAYSQSAIDAFGRAISSADRLLQHPGLSAAVGSGFDPASWGTFNPISGNTLAGTEAANFKAELGAMKAQVFLPMVQSMKGMGALSNAEGEKLTASIGALDPNMSEAGFKQSLNRIKTDLQYYMNRAAEGGQSTPSPRAKPKEGNKPSVSNW